MPFITFVAVLSSKILSFLVSTVQARQAVSPGAARPRVARSAPTMTTAPPPPSSTAARVARCVPSAIDSYISIERPETIIDRSVAIKELIPVCFMSVASYRLLQN